VFEHLPREISVTSVFEGGVDIVRNGKPARADEYSFAVTGPSERFKQHAEICHRQSRGIWPKFQVTVTHELASMPNLPVPGCLYDKISAARQLGCTGALAIWTMGVAANLNSFAAGQLLAHTGELPPREHWLRWLARTYFGDALTDRSIDAVVRAWDAFGRAMQHHPMETNFLYFSPVNYAPAYPWTLKRVGTRMARSWMPEPWGDKLEMSCDRLTLDDVAATLDLLANEWNAALPGYRDALATPASTNQHAREELNVAEACGLFFRSCADCYAFALAAQAGDRDKTLRLIARERDTVHRLLPLMESDARLGWHDDLQRRFVDPPMLREKLKNLEQLEDQITMRTAP
jgi:hypothetical protein